MMLNEQCAIQDEMPSLLTTFNIEWAKKKVQTTEFLFKMPILACVVKRVDFSFGIDAR
jgi:hypothetical protein